MSTKTIIRVLTKKSPLSFEEIVSRSHSQEVAIRIGLSRLEKEGKLQKSVIEEGGNCIGCGCGACEPARTVILYALI